MWQGEFLSSNSIVKSWRFLRCWREPKLNICLVCLFSFTVFKFSEIQWLHFTLFHTCSPKKRVEKERQNLLSTSTNSSISACLKHTMWKQEADSHREGVSSLKKTESFNSFVNLHEWKRAIAYLLSDTKAQEQLFVFLIYR